MEIVLIGQPDKYKILKNQPAIIWCIEPIKKNVKSYEGTIKRGET